ncbi:hypothetical protein FHS02_001767 [Massilia umbonata]|uniref:Uncharacterized protein n=1 Tax=Pseudoduganella umbonata TaxID=864828 RepID=A0A7W5E9D4_9BURK|nr:hypothetical protein [Pseudoduganella umbonata]
MQVWQPFVAQPQAGQRRAGQGVEAAPAHHAAITLQTIGMAAAVALRTAAQRTCRSAGGFLDQAQALARLHERGERALQQGDLILGKLEFRERRDDGAELCCTHTAS